MYVVPACTELAMCTDIKGADLMQAVYNEER